MSCTSPARGSLGVYIGVILGVYGDNEKENGNYYGVKLGLYWDNGKEKETTI